MNEPKKAPIDARLNRPYGSGMTINNLGKVPPHNRELEEAVLGAMLLERDAVTNGIQILRPEVFYFEQHQKIFEAIIHLFGASAPIDVITVGQKLREMGAFDFIGGAYYLAQLSSRVSSSANLESHARYLLELAMKRDLIRIGGQMSSDAFEDSNDVFELLDKAGQAIFDVADSNIKRDFQDLAKVIKDALDTLNEKTKNQDPNGINGVPTGFTPLDAITGGWQTSDLVIVAGRPGMGKTAFMLSAARNAAVDYKKAVAIFSLEMSAEQLVNRLLSSECSIESEKMRKGNLSPDEFRQIQGRLNKLADAKIFLDDTPALSVLELRAKCRKIKTKYNALDLVIIDYLQLMTAQSANRNSNREQEIGYISRSLKALAKEMNVPVIALAQLSRETEKRADKKPQLSDLRESGSIEQDADMVLFLHRPEYYGITEDENGQSVEGQGNVVIAKNRHGETNTVTLRYVGRYTRFENWDEASFGDSFSSTSGMPAFGSTFDNPAAGGSPVKIPSRMNRPRPGNEDASIDDVPF